MTTTPRAAPPRRDLAIGEVARQAGVSVRTLHHYDAIGLLSPSGRTAAGYRRYSPADRARLHLIVLLRALDLPLEEVRRVLDAPGAEPARVLRQQRARLVAEQLRMSSVLAALDRTLEVFEKKGKLEMEDTLEGFESVGPLAEEARARYGHTEAWAESQRRTRRYSKEDWKRLQAESEAVVRAVAALQAAGESPASAPARAEAERHRLHVDRWFYPCSLEHHRQLADLYEADARFTAHYEAVAPGLASYLAAAIRANADQPRPAG